MGHWFWKALVVLTVLALAGWGAARRFARGNGRAAAFRTAPVERGDLTATIKATGTLEPEEVIDVGAQVAGLVLSFGKGADGQTVDYGSAVEEGMVLAQIDESLCGADVALAEAQLQQAEGQVLHANAEVETSAAGVQASEAQVQQAEAQVQQAHAGVAKSEADLKQMRAKLVQAKSDWDRAQKLGPSEALAQCNYDAYKAAYETAGANVEVGEAAVRIATSTVAGSKGALAQAKCAVAQAKGALAQAKSTVVQANGQFAQAKATLARARRNLSYCTIKSPVKGVILARRVNIGQTMVASLSAPSLFLIARDLTRMQVWVAVNEADIGRIRPGQPVTFTVDTFPGEVFRGTVRKIRLDASMTQNVITYTVEIATANPNGRLLPYLTANVQFQVDRRENVLLVPNAALRWTPAVEQVGPEFQGSVARAAAPGNRPGASQPPAAKPAPEAVRSGVVWVPAGAQVRPLSVRAGLSDGVRTEVEGDGLADGLEVVTGVETQSAGPAATKSPFATNLPPPPRGMPPK
jgi:HlyD family secretion protein